MKGSGGRLIRRCVSGVASGAHLSLGGNAEIRLTMTISWPRLFASTRECDQYVNERANYCDLENIV